MTFSQENSVLILVDVQQRLLDKISGYQSMVAACKTMVLAVKHLQIPVFWLEQYPKGLGPTVPELAEHLQGKPIEKGAFSGYCEEGCKAILDGMKRKQAIVIGMEAHVCVWQTTQDLLQSGYEVAVVMDAVSSRTEVNRQNALLSMQQAGARVVSSEMILFELLKTSSNPAFRQVQKLIV